MCVSVFVTSQLVVGLLMALVAVVYVRVLVMSMIEFVL